MIRCRLNCAHPMYYMGRGLRRYQRLDRDWKSGVGDVERRWQLDMKVETLSTRWLSLQTRQLLKQAMDAEAHARARGYPPSGPYKASSFLHQYFSTSSNSRQNPTNCSEIRCCSTAKWQTGSNAGQPRPQLQNRGNHQSACEFLRCLSLT